MILSFINIRKVKTTSLVTLREIMFDPSIQLRYNLLSGTEIATTPSSSTSLTSGTYPLFTTMTPLGKFSTFPLKIKTRWPLNDVEAESSKDMEAEFLKFTTQKSVNIPQPFPEPWPVQPRTWEPKLPDHDEVSGTQMPSMALVQLFVLIIVVYFAIC